jgi:hypothetical protein
MPTNITALYSFPGARFDRLDTIIEGLYTITDMAIHMLCHPEEEEVAGGWSRPQNEELHKHY